MIKKFAFPVVLLMIVVLRIVLVPHQEQTASEPTVSKPYSHPFFEKRSREDLRKRIQGLERQATEKEKAAIRRCLTKIENSIRQAFIGNISRIDTSVDELTNPEGTLLLVTLLVEDKIQGTNKTSAHINSVVIPSFTIPLRLASQGVHAHLAELEKELRGITYEFCSSVTNVERVEALIEDDFLKDLSIPHIPSVLLTNAAAKTTSAITTLTAEAILSRSLVACIQRVLGYVVTRIGTTAAISTTLVVADGPIPIGDAIAAVVGVGGLVWSGYDLYEARKILIPEVRRQLHSDYSAQQISMQKAAEARTLNLAAEYQNARTQFASNYLN